MLLLKLNNFVMESDKIISTILCLPFDKATTFIPILYKIEWYWLSSFFQFLIKSQPLFFNTRL